jgi:rubrerythrin
MLAAVEKRIFDRRYPWHEIDREKALENTLVLDRLREACLIESYFAVYTGKMLALFWYDVDATSIFTIEAFEAYTHYYGLRRYLSEVGYKPVTDPEIAALREKDLHNTYTDEIRELVNFAMTEHFARHFFTDLSEIATEPLLKTMLTDFSTQEATHSEFALELLEKRLQSNPALKDSILQHALNYTHIGAYVLPTISTAKEDNLQAILGFNKRVEQLVGQSLTDYLASSGLRTED